MKLKIVQVGEPVLRRPAQLLSVDEIHGEAIQRLIGLMKETMRDAPGVGLAAPQVGLSLQLAVIEDRPEYLASVPADVLSQRDRAPVAFHVIINPEFTIRDETQVDFFEGCLSLVGFTAIVPRALAIQVKCLNERAEPVIINARGWYARILQHEIDHLRGALYIDRMDARSFMSVENHYRYWKEKSIADVLSKLTLAGS
jgi:peptide deformylase